MFLLSNMNFLIVSVLEKVLSEKEQVRSPKFTVEWKFSSPSSKFKEHADTKTIGINSLYLGSKIAASVLVSI